MNSEPMEPEELAEVLNKLLVGDEGTAETLRLKQYSDRRGNGFQITYGAMYDRPELNFDVLMKLSELFGTNKIDVDQYGIGGCETCDYGSDYGHEIVVLEPTKVLWLISQLDVGELDLSDE